MFTYTQIVTLLCWVGVFSMECTFHSSEYLIVNLNACENKQNGHVKFPHECLLGHTVFRL